MRWLLGTLLVLAGCTSEAPTSAPRTAPAVPVFDTTTAPASRATRPFPKSCGEVLTAKDLDALVDKVIPTGTAVVIGQPMPGIRRTARIDCYYAIASGAPATSAPLVVTLAGYQDAASAQARVEATVADSPTATPTEVRVGPDKGVLLDATTTRTLIAAHDTLTVVVTALPSLVSAAEAPSVLAGIADRALTAR